MGWPRFTLRDILIAIGLIAVGLGVLAEIIRRDPGCINFGILLVLYFGSFAMIGAGLFTPFHKWMIGAVVGCVTAFVIMVGLFAMMIIYHIH